MNCEHVERDLDAYLDRELGSEFGDGRSASTSSSCAACRRRVAEREALEPARRSGAVLRSSGSICGHECGETNGASDDRRARLLAWAAAAVLAVSVGGGVTLVRSASTRADAIGR